MEEDRLQGYVLGQDGTTESSWKVRVTQEGHPEHWKKFFVASTKDGLKLARGLKVTFIIGSFGCGGKKKAVDVMVASTRKRQEERKEGDRNEKKQNTGI